MATGAVEETRRQLVHDLRLLHTLPDPSFDAIADAAAAICEKEISLVSFFEGDNQWFKSCHGLDIDKASREVSFCAHVIESAKLDEIFEVPDTHLDARFQDNVMVTGAPHFRFYAGVPLRPIDDVAVGTLCVLGRNPGCLTDAQKDALIRLGCVAEELMRLHQVASTEAELLERVRRSEQDYEYLAEHTADVVFVHDREMNRLYYSPNMPGFFGYTQDEVEALDAEHRFLLADKISVVEGGENGFTEAEPALTARGYGQNKDGSLRDVSMEVLAVFADHEVVEYRTTVRDIGAIMAYEARLHDADGHLLSAVTKRSHAVRSIAHDLSSPLAAIRLTTESLRDQLVASPVRTQANYLVEVARHAEALIGDLRMVNDPDGDDPSMSISCHNLRPLVERATRQVVGDLSTDHVMLDLSDVFAAVDEHAVSRVVTNLVMNALRHNLPGTTVSVSLIREGESAWLRVEDDGTGIPDEERDRMLEPYEALNPGGSGLGLAITKALVQAHGGTLDIGGRLPSGTAVSVTFPLDQPNCP